MKSLVSRWFSLRTKIILPYLVLALVLALGAGVIGTRIVVDSIEERFVNQLIEAGKLSSDSMVQEETDLLAFLRLVSHSEGIAEAIRADDADKLRNLTLPLAVNARQEAIEILNTDGISVLSLNHREGGNIEEYDSTRGDDSFRDLALVRQTLQGRSDFYGDKFAEAVPTARGDRLYISGAVLDDKNTLVGLVLVGRSLNSLVRDTRELTLAQLSLYAPNGQVLATTLVDKQPLDRPIAETIPSLKESTSYMRDFESSSIAYREIVGVWQVRGNRGMGLIGASFAKNFLVRVSQNTWVQVAGSLLMAFVLVLAIGLVLSNQISQPILDLAHASARVRDGDLSTRLEPRGRDEVARLTAEFNQMVESLGRSKKDLVAAYDATLEGWVRALDLRDRETGDHTSRTASMTVRLAKDLGVNPAELDNIRRGALLHDIGKMAIPDEILLKPGPLTDEEWSLMHRHPAFAVEMLQDIAFLRPALEIPAAHHENWDGNGYPKGLKGEEIPIAARIFAVVDSWDALTSDRPYRKAMTELVAREIIVAGSGSHFDPRVVQAFLKLLGELGK